MSVVSITNLTSNLLSTDVGLIEPGATLSRTMGPNDAYKCAATMKNLVDSGHASVSISAEDALLDALEPAAVGTASVADGAVTTAKLAALSVTAAKIAADAVTTAKILDTNVTTAKLAANAVTTAKITDANVTAAKMAMFVSAVITGNGSSQNTAHGLGTTPSKVLVCITTVASATDATTQGVHDGTNCKVTASTGCKYQIIAFA